MRWTASGSELPVGLILVSERGCPDDGSAQRRTCSIARVEREIAESGQATSPDLGHLVSTGGTMKVVDGRLRKPTSLPVEAIWRDDGEPLELVRRRPLGADAVKDLLRTTDFEFAVINLGSNFEWISGSDRFDFWKRELQPRLVEPEGETRVRLEDYPGEYAYFASLWTGSEQRASAKVVLLEMIH